MYDLQQQIGVLQWVIGIGRIDMIAEVSTLYQHVCAPCVNHLEALYKIYKCTRENMKLNQVTVGFYPTNQEINDRLFEDHSKVM